MSTRSFARSLLLFTTPLVRLAAFVALAGCTSPAADSSGSGGASLETGASSEAALRRKYAAIAGTWKALDAVPPASADGIPSYTTYAFAADGSFVAWRSCRTRAADAGACDAATTVSGTWEIFTTLPTLPRIDMTWAGTRESYVFSLQADLLVLDGIDALFQHDLASLPVVEDGAICEDASWSSIARCPPDIGVCDHETHRCLQPS